VEVIGRALLLAVDGLGFRPIAAELGLPESTVRGWLRRARFLAEVIRQHFTRWAFVLDPLVATGRPAGSGLAGAVDAIGRCGRAASLRLGRRAPWRLASALSGGGLLCTSWPWLPPP
jgi:Helix-turn-helix domain